LDGADRNVLLVPERGAGLPQSVKVMLLANRARQARHLGWMLGEASLRNGCFAFSAV